MFAYDLTNKIDHSYLGAESTFVSFALWRKTEKPQTLNFNYSVLSTTKTFTVMSAPYNPTVSSNYSPGASVPSNLSTNKTVIVIAAVVCVIIIIVAIIVGVVVGGAQSDDASSNFIH